MSQKSREEAAKAAQLVDETEVVNLPVDGADVGASVVFDRLQRTGAIEAIEGCARCCACRQKVTGSLGILVEPCFHLLCMNVCHRLKTRLQSLRNQQNVLIALAQPQAIEPLIF